MKTKPLIVANWKMNLVPTQSVELLRCMLSRIKKSKLLGIYEFVVCPSLESIAHCADVVRKASRTLSLGAQNCFWEVKGAYTGETSPVSLENLGCAYCIVGHSERRGLLGETDSIVAKKMKSIFLTTQLTPILCVGESKQERTQGKTRQVLTRQLKSALHDVPASRTLVVAYEPVWAIGSGKVITPHDCKDAIDSIRTTCQQQGVAKKNLSVLYGGSVTHESILTFVSKGLSDGVLIGGASSDTISFQKILSTLTDSTL